ncbi:hypothetical protein L873DRAFT_1821534 [Choiromyces venosus 120613-1]|uniref:Uncharacterized protein n=1 Tax=Choiromyces venosus 120613-1 TaxID=1336337 RepID=A0A3N4J161_9PEZI|nr:hypothetical protein L873DRAFT_1821534 [Choiromyces venosus 120613-1]
MFPHRTIRKTEAKVQREIQDEKMVDIRNVVDNKLLSCGQWPNRLNSEDEGELVYW